MTCKALVAWAESPPPEKEHPKKKAMRSAVLKHPDKAILAKLSCSANSWRARAQAARKIFSLPVVPKLVFGVTPKSPVPFNHNIRVRALALGLKVVSIDGGAFLHER